MRILVISHEYPPIGGGGGRVAQDLCEGLVKRGHEVRVLTAHIDGLPLEEERAGVHIQRLISGRSLPYVASFAAMLRYVWLGFWAGLPIVRNWKPDLIHVHFAVPGGPIALALNNITGVPYVLTVHLGDVPGGTPEKTDHWFRWVYPFTPRVWRSAARVAAVSEFTRRLAKDHYDVPVQVIPNGVDLTALTPGENTGIPRLIFAGRFVPQKNPMQVVRVLAGLKDLPWHCVMAGDGGLSEQVKTEVHRLEMDNRFTFTGWIEPEDVLAEYKKCDILFMPSLSEGLPVVGVQALAMGLSLAVSRVGGFVELVQEGENGFLFDPMDTAAAQTGLRALLSDPGRLAKSRQASRAFAAHFDLNRILQAYETLFTEVTKERKS